MSSYKVVIEGKALPGFASDDVRPRLAALVNRSEEVAGRLLSGHRSTVKSGVDQATATRYLNALTGIGVECCIERESLDIDLPEPKASISAPERTRKAAAARPIAVADTPEPLEKGPGDALV